MAWIGPNQSGAQAVPADRVVGASEDAVRHFLQRVYRYMSLGLLTTGAVALIVVSSPGALRFVYGNPLVFVGAILLELGLVWAFTSVARRASAGATAAMFFAYAAVSGVTFSVIFLRYTAGSIASTFLVTGGTFAALSAYGAATKRDLSSIGSFCLMGLVGLIIASVVNLFLGSPMLYWLTTFGGVIVFTGLTAYDTAKLKEVAAVNDGEEAQTKRALQGALVLYLDFINLFLYLIRLLGRRR
jgi:FtsH-binding integral membrane protein